MIYRFIANYTKLLTYNIGKQYVEIVEIRKNISDTGNWRGTATDMQMQITILLCYK